MRNVIYRTLGPHSTLLAFSNSDIFASLLGCYLMGGDCQNNDFGWAHLPFSFLNENTVFLIATAILKNFYLYFLDVLRGRAEGVGCSTRIKRFVRRFVAVLAKWTRSGRMDVLTLYTKRQIYLSLCG